MEEVKLSAIQLAEIDRHLDIALSAKTVTPHERFQLRHLLAYYAKKKHPFTACVRDNIKRWGQPLTNKRCAVLKDLIVGNTHWRKGRQTGFSEEVYEVDESTIDLLLEALQDEEFKKFCLSL